MPRLSIIVPHQGQNGPFEDTLVSVLQNRPADCEVVVPHLANYRDPYDLADEARFVSSPVAASLIDLLNTAIAKARGEIIHILCNGAQASEGWADAAVARFDGRTGRQVGSVGPCPASRSGLSARDAVGVTATAYGARRVVHYGESQSKRGPAPIGPTLSAGFYRAELLKSLGGFYSPVGSQLADLDVALSFAAAGYRYEVADDSCVTLQDEPAGDPYWTYSAGRRQELLRRRHDAQLQSSPQFTADGSTIAKIAGGAVHPIGWLLRALGRGSASRELASGHGAPRQLPPPQDVLPFARPADASARASAVESRAA